MKYVLKPNWNLNLEKKYFPEFKFKSLKKLFEFSKENNLLISHHKSTLTKSIYIYF